MTLRLNPWVGALQKKVRFPVISRGLSPSISAASLLNKKPSHQKVCFTTAWRLVQNGLVEQLCFFRFAKPLVERFGEDFFKKTPRAPGVYLMLDSCQRVIYVGQSHNLRIRLAYYKNAQPEREPRKIIRMVHRIDRIELEQCDTPEQAQLRELELIRQHRPRFNVANNLSPIYSFFGWRVESFCLRLRLLLSPECSANEQVEGAFKSRGLCRRALIAIGRLLWAAENQPQSIYDFPLNLSPACKTTQIDLTLSQPERSVATLATFLGGENAELVSQLRDRFPQNRDSFLAKILDADLATIEQFYQSGPERLRQLRQFHSLTGPIPQDRLDPLLLLMRQGRPQPLSNDVE